MKTKIIIRTVVMLFVTFFIWQDATAQFGMDYAGGPVTHFSRLRRHVGGGPMNQFLQNQNNEKALGVYTAEVFPSSMLEVNTTTLYTPFFHNNIANRGEVFRTACPTADAPFWRMFRDSTERFRIYNPNIGLNNGLVLETVQSPGGWMAFNTALTTRMFIRDGGNLSTDGFVGVGNSFTSPVSRLHQHEPYNTFNYHQFTNANTGATSTDGLKVGIDANGIAQVMQQENKDMAFYTDNTQRLTITATGSITINSLCSTTQSLVTADKNGTLTTTTAETIIAQSQTILELKQKITGLETIINQLTAQNFKTESN